MIIVPASIADKDAANSIRFIFKAGDYAFAEAVVSDNDEDYDRWQRQNLIYEN